MRYPHWILRRLSTALALFLVLPGLALAADAPVDLSGPWRFRLDRDDVGLKEHWANASLDGAIRLPGALQNQGFGDDVTARTKWTGDVGPELWLKRPEYAPYRQPGNIKIPWALQPEKHYVGTAWYQRDLDVPPAWQGQRVVLTLERPHWQTRAWLDGRPLGTRDSLSAPHVYDLGTALAPGRHTLTLRVDNRLIVDVGSWAHSVTDHTQGNWNGVAGSLTLTATSPVWIDDVQAYPDPAKKSVRLKVRVGNATGKPGKGTLAAGKTSVPVAWDAAGGSAELEVSLAPDAAAWDEFRPTLHELTVCLAGEDADDTRTVRFGLREVGTRGTQLTINGRPLFLRGTLECCIFPLTGYPPTDVESWKRIIRICKDHGLNHIRFHSWCPPEAAFTAADELGFYYQVEVAAWTVLGDGAPIDRWLYEEAERILTAYGNHPSFVLMPYGNEPSGKNHVAYLKKWVDHWKARDPRRLYTSGSAYPQIPENQFHVMYTPRGPGGWNGRDYRDAVKGQTVPVIVHEMGQWCVYPNLDEIAKYKGPLKAKNFEIVRDGLAARGRLDRWRDYLNASGRLQVLCYKEEVEAALRTPGISGVQLLDLHDFPGQGTALVGVLDPFWDQKGYVTPAEFRRFFGPTVPLARLPRRAWTASERLTADVEIAHFGQAPLENAVPQWRLIDAAGTAVASGEWPARTIPVDRGVPLGKIAVDLARLPAPAAYRLVVGLKEAPIENDWNVWVYPASVPTTAPPGVLVKTAPDEALASHLAAGGTGVLFVTRLDPEHPRGSFTPIFWNRYMFHTQGTQTLGLLCDPAHPALKGFPTGIASDWQWEPVLARSRGIVLDGAASGVRPIVAWVDDWNTNRNLALVFECRVGPGRLLVCAADLEGDLDKRPSARQLSASLLAYAAGPAFAPEKALAWDELTRILTPRVRSRLAEMGAKVVSVDSEDVPNKNLAAHVIDGDPDTFWHTRWADGHDPMPHQLVIDMGRPVTLRGLVFWPRQDQANGRIAACDLFLSEDGQNWGTAVARPEWPDTSDKQTVTFAKPAGARYLKVVVRKEVNNNPFAALGEVDILPADK